MRTDDFLGVDGQLADDESAIRDTVRDFAAGELAPNVTEWFEAGALPAELGRALASSGCSACT